jgi:hypothetical protein
MALSRDARRAALAQELEKLAAMRQSAENFTVCGAVERLPS